MSSCGPIKTSDIIFPVLSTNFSHTLSSLKRSALSVSNRLNSISKDADFVYAVAEARNLPLVANERCGSWYISPERKAGSAYFKSTDGHTGQWSFSLRRLNTQVLDVVGKHGGCIIVDSTRRGKSMPDALSKTVPIWCCVLNRILFPDPDLHSLYTPPQAVSASEHSQIEARLDNFVQQLKGLNINIQELRAKIFKPLRPIWITQDSHLTDEPFEFPTFYQVVLCTSSHRVHGGEVSEGGYIQGAADDSEAWAHGLTPSLFWKHKETLLATNEDDLPDLISELLQETNIDVKSEAVRIKPTSNLYVSSIDDAISTEFDTIVHCAKGPPEYVSKSQAHLHLKCRDGKLGSRDLRDALPALESWFSGLKEIPKKIIVCCRTGKDLALGVALAILCLFSDENGIISTTPRTLSIDKTFVRQRLSWITTSYPTANPARATLQSINSFLIRPSKPTPLPLHMSTSDLADQTISLTSSPTLSATRTSTSRLFTSFHGAWSVSRKLTSSLSTQPSGIFTGIAKFIPRTPSDIAFSEEYLYEEEGTFRIIPSGFEFSARKRYAYRYDEVKDEISVWFVDEGSKDPMPSVTGLFIEMGMKEVGQTEEGSGSGTGKVRLCEGKEKHLCGEDLYAASYKFGPGMMGPERRVGDEDEWWEVRYDVKGPKKDYISQTTYSKIP